MAQAQGSNLFPNMDIITFLTMIMQQGSVIHPGPDRTRCFCSGPDPARTRDLPCFAIFFFFVTCWAFFQHFWGLNPVQDPARTQNETGGPGPDPTGKLFCGSQTPAYYPTFLLFYLDVTMSGLAWVRWVSFDWFGCLYLVWFHFFCHV